jgi:hypothetical protein
MSSAWQRPPWIPPTDPAAAPRFAWDEWRITDTYQPGDDAVRAVMAGVTVRANMAVCTAMAEWVVWRFEPLSGDIRPLLMLQAAWAAGVHTAYARYHEFNDDEWRGVVRGPMRMALGIVIDLIWSQQTAEAGQHVAWMSQLAERVLPDPAPFRQWRSLILDRMQAQYPRTASDVVFEDDFDPGPWVPREAMNPAVRLTPSEVRQRMEDFVATLNPATNPYLHEPTEMLAFSDYSGTPYRLGPQDH